MLPVDIALVPALEGIMHLLCYCYENTPNNATVPIDSYEVYMAGKTQIGRGLKQRESNG